MYFLFFFRFANISKSCCMTHFNTLHPNVVLQNGKSEHYTVMSRVKVTLHVHLLLIVCCEPFIAPWRSFFFSWKMQFCTCAKCQVCLMHLIKIWKFWIEIIASHFILEETLIHIFNNQTFMRFFKTLLNCGHLLHLS